MTPSEIDELERLMTAATPAARWDRAWDTRPYARDGYPMATYAIGPQHGTPKSRGSDEDREACDRAASARNADVALIHTLVTSAPALIEAAREVERLRAFVPRWERVDKMGGLRLRLGALTLASIARNWDGLWYYRLEVERTDYPTADDAARAVCARLGIPYVPVEVSDG